MFNILSLTIVIQISFVNQFNYSGLYLFSLSSGNTNESEIPKSFAADSENQEQLRYVVLN